MDAPRSEVPQPKSATTKAQGERGCFVPVYEAVPYEAPRAPFKASRATPQRLQCRVIGCASAGWRPH